MRRRFALRAEVGRSLYQPGAEELLPEAVHRHARSQRMLRADEPLGEVEAVGRAGLGQRREHGGDVRPDLLAGLVVLAAQHHEAVAGLLQILPDESRRDGLVEVIAGLGNRVFLRVDLGEGGARGIADELEVIVAQPLVFLGLAVLGLHGAEQAFHLVRHVRERLALIFLEPDGERFVRVFRGIAFAGDADVVPRHRAPEERESEALDFIAGLEAKLRRGELQFHPLAGLGQVAEALALVRVALAEVNRVEVAPHRAVRPVAGVELEHHGLRWVLRVEEDVEEDLAVGRDGERCLELGEKVLPHAWVGALQRALAGENLAVFFRDPLRGGRSSAGLHLRAGGEVVVHPSRVELLERRRRVERGRVGVNDLRQLGLDALVHGGDLRVEVVELLLLLGGGELERGCGEQRVAVHRGVRVAVEERIHRVKVLHRERVVFVVVADRTTGGQAHPHGRRGLRAVHGVAVNPLLVDAAALAGGDVAPVETRGDELVLRRVREQVACELLNGELVERQVAVERAHDPVAVRPHGTLVVQVHAMRVAVARGVEPMPAHVLAVVR